MNPFLTDARIENEFKAYSPRMVDFTMVDQMKCYNLYLATKYVLEAGVPGSLVECGVWKGGCAMLMALTTLARGGSSRDIYLYDTYAGMAEPDAKDLSWDGKPAMDQWAPQRTDDGNDWCRSSLAETQRNVLSTGYDASRLHFIAGLVEDTIPGPAVGGDAAPADIALLRLDTDFYRSSMHELEHLFPRLAMGGVLILDDYSYWQGQRQAVDEYFASQGVHMLLNMISTSAVGIKVDGPMYEPPQDAMAESSSGGSGLATG